MHCRAELCENWSGDGNVCPCAVFDLTPTPPDDNETRRGRRVMATETQPRLPDPPWSWGRYDSLREATPPGMEWVRYCTPAITPSQRVRWWAE